MSLKAQGRGVGGGVGGGSETGGEVGGSVPFSVLQEAALAQEVGLVALDTLLNFTKLNKVLFRF